MKNSLDIIIASTVFVIALIVSGVCYASKRTVTKPAEPKQPVLSKMAMPNIHPQMENGLTLAGNKNGGGMPTGFGGGAGFSGAGNIPPQMAEAMARAQQGGGGAPRRGGARG